VGAAAGPLFAACLASGVLLRWRRIERRELCRRQNALTGGPKMQEGPEKSKKVQIDLPPDVAAGMYANAVHISVTPGEFVIDFARALPGMGKVQVHSRIILPPIAAKGLRLRLEQAVNGFEDKFGEIRLPGGQKGKPPFDYGAFDGDPTGN